ncbi:MAG: cell division protein FtsZ [Deltaproteobacteria bacterium]|nr:cell division protein FtsZ [Deltaproteobacteria bacterium]
MRFELDGNEPKAKIKVVGVGGGGGNAVANMIAQQIEGVDFLIANTDHQALDAHPAAIKIQIGTNLTKGLGAGGNPEMGRKAALEDVAALEEQLRGADMVFIAAGMGGGTGTGAAPIVAQVAKECGALTVGVVSKPFKFEGRRRMRFAEEGIFALGESLDTQIIIPNDGLLNLKDNLAIKDAFLFADQVLCNAVRGISDLITIRGDINVDFADVRTIMTNKGRALMGTGYGKGENRAYEAAEMAINSPLLEDIKIDGATGILINITGGPDMTMNEVSEAVGMIEDSADEDAHIIFGYVTLEEPCDEIKCTVIATGFNSEEDLVAPQTQRPSFVSTRNIYQEQGSAGMTSRNSLIPSKARESAESVSAASVRSALNMSSGSHEANLDIPAFIRRNQD